MKKCVNCKEDNRDTDTYCRNCGVVIKSNSYYVIINVLTVISFIFLIIVIGLFITLYSAY